MHTLNMKILFKCFVTVSLLFLVACSGESSTRAKSSSPLVCTNIENCSHVDLQKGFFFIKSSGKSTVLGTNVKSAKASERPEMDVSFDYNFQLGEHEVTCGEFNDLMSGENSLKLECSQDSLPASFVTYYDAVLFANAKSKKEGKDTAYVYSSAEFNKDGHCVLLNGFSFKPEVDAFRLPTEAEWVFAAGLSFNSQNSWNSENSDFKAHPVCQKRDKNGFCDLAGNMVEWVNDWLGNFRDTTIKNYMGAPNGGNFDERVIKGGSFRTDPSVINLYARGDVYTVSSASLSDYLGFRLAYGKIEKPVWLDASGDAVASVMTTLSNRKNLSSLLGTSRLKLAFRNDVTGNLAYVDFSRLAPMVVEIKDSLDVFHPDISPDGKRVAFCTGYEGVSGISAVYVRDLNESGSNLLKLDVKSAVIPRWRVLENGDTVIVYVTDAGDNTDGDAFKSTSTWQVKFSNGKFETPEKLFNGAYHGGISNDNKLTVSGARRLRARIAKAGSTITGNAVDTMWYKNGDKAEQACNASLNKSTKRTLFLDFAGEPGKEFVGKTYYTHERLFVADSAGKLLSSVAAPKDYTFDHSEWVLNDENFAVVTLVNIDGSHQKIALVNVKEGSVMELVEGDELWHPCFWTPIDKTVSGENWSADSVGNYFSAENQTYVLLSHKMAMFWSLKDSAELIALGNSHMRSGFDPMHMSVSSINMSAIPCDMHCIHYLFKNYALNLCPKLKYVFVSLDFDLWFHYDERTDINDNLKDAPGYEYDKNHDYYPAGVDADFVNLVWENASFDAEDLLATKGWFNTNENAGWFDENGVSDLDMDSTWSNCLLNKNFVNCMYDSDESTCTSIFEKKVCEPDSSVSKCLAKYKVSECLSPISRNLSKFKDLISLASKQNIIVIGVVFPVSPFYKSTGAYSRHGLQRSHAVKIIEELQQMAAENSNFIFMDENKMGDHDYPTSMAFDYDHLNSAGAAQMSARVDSLIKTLKSKSKK